MECEIYDMPPLPRGATGTCWKRFWRNPRALRLLSQGGFHRHAGNSVCRSLLLLCEGVHAQMTSPEGRGLTLDTLSAPDTLASAFIFGTENRYPVSVVGTATAGCGVVGRENMSCRSSNRQGRSAELLDHPLRPQPLPSAGGSTNSPLQKASPRGSWAIEGQPHHQQHSRRRLHSQRPRSSRDDRPDGRTGHGAEGPGRNRAAASPLGTKSRSRSKPGPASKKERFVLRGRIAKQSITGPGIVHLLVLGAQRVTHHLHPAEGRDGHVHEDRVPRAIAPFHRPGGSWAPQLAAAARLRRDEARRGSVYCRRSNFPPFES